MKKILKLSTGIVFALAATGLYAEGSYLGLGAGLMFNLGQLGGTIANDGLNSSVGNRQATNNFEEMGTQQKLIYPENELIGLEKNTNQAFRSKTSGSMTGLVLTVYYEKEFSWLFVRGGASYNKKVFGGHSESTIATVKWYDVSWDYKALVVPVYAGIKANVGDTAAVYFGGGVNYHEGGWDLYGTNMGDIPTALLGRGIGAHTVRDNQTGAAKGGNLYNERIEFRVKGFGFNFVMGAEGKLESGNKIFFEVDTVIAGGYGNSYARNQSNSTRDHFAAIPVKVTVLAGTSYSFGYKMKL